MLYSNVSCFRESYWGTARSKRMGRASQVPKDGARCEPADGACSSSSWLLGSAHAEKEEGARGRSCGVTPRVL
jgi:hypothetical protein